MGDADGSWAPLRPATLAGARTHNWQHFGRCAGLTGLVSSLRPAPVYSPLTKHGEAVRRLPLAKHRYGGPLPGASQTWARLIFTYEGR